MKSKGRSNRIEIKEIDVLWDASLEKRIESE